MKKSILLLFANVRILALAVALSLSACQVLDEEAYDFLTPEKFYQNEADATAAVNGVYDRLKSVDYYNRVAWELDFTDDETKPGTPHPDRGPIEDFTMNAENIEIGAWWREMYLNINRANAVIENIEPMQLDAAVKARLLGEAKFLRALGYHNLVKVFGGVPLRLTESKDLSALQQGRASESEVHTQIEADLLAAEVGLPASNATSDVGRATKGAAMALLARTYAYMAGNNRQSPYWQKVLEKTQAVMGLGYELFADYRDVFDVAKKNGKEHIFSVQFGCKENKGGSWYDTYVTPANAPAIGVGYGVWVPEVPFYRAFPESHRKDVTFLTFNNVPYIRKYQDANDCGSQNASNNYPVIRYADVLLLFAEAANEVNNGPTLAAYEAVNQVRRRAYKLDLKTPSVNDLQANLTYAAFKDAVLEERHWELCFEGHRKYDLDRTGRLTSVLTAAGKTNVRDYHRYFPIPQRELALNRALEQNAGY